MTPLITKGLIKHGNKFNSKVFHDRENSENRFSEFLYFMKCLKKYILKLSRLTQWNYREIRISWNSLKEIFHSVSSPSWLSKYDGIIYGATLGGVILLFSHNCRNILVLRFTCKQRQINQSFNHIRKREFILPAYYKLKSGIYFCFYFPLYSS